MEETNRENIFGDWTNHTRKFNEEFLTNEPYEHVQIPNFFNEEFANSLVELFPTLDHPRWYQYNNPIEKKYSLNHFQDLPKFRRVFDTLQSDAFIHKMKEITSIPNLEKDPFLHGAGLHYHPRGGKLDMHLDYSIHPITKKERRVNLIIYLNREWREEWNGSLELWNNEYTHCVKKILQQWNSDVLFRTSDISYHGMPRPFMCPEEMGRKSIAIYYVSEPRPEATIRYKAEFYPLPEQPVNEKLAELYEIRKIRNLSKVELDRVYPEWESEGNGYW
jgi:Rps23 Pro-64 3,4-dihydroxylase Tpa1-like proline 4-hydroxylase